MNFRRVLFHEDKKENNAASAFKNICATYDEDSLLEYACQKWFTRFREGNFNCFQFHSDCNEEAIRGHLSKNFIFNSPIVNNLRYIRSGIVICSNITVKNARFFSPLSQKDCENLKTIGRKPTRSLFLEANSK